MGEREKGEGGGGRGGEGKGEGRGEMWFIDCSCIQLHQYLTHTCIESE